MRPLVRPDTTLPLVAIIIVLVAALLGPLTVSAQVAGVLPKAPQLPGSTRAMALGDSHIMNDGAADVLFYHPALLTGARGFGLATQRWTASGSAAAIAAAIPTLGGGVGIGLRTLQYSAAGSGPLAAPAGQDHLFTPGSIPVSEQVATIGYAREAFFGIDVGVAMNLVDERVGTTRHGVALFDAGASMDAGRLKVALTATGIGNKPVLDTGAEPLRVVLGGGAYGLPVGIFDVGLATHLGVADGDMTYGGGLEVGYWPVQGRTFVARVGFQDVADGSDAQPFTTGFAFWADDFTVEWAFRPFSGADEGGTH
jgi:hypothetical protein